MRLREAELNQEIYHYPEHLRHYLDELPKSAGVYIFWGASETLPLYIGKSINIRSRVMAHFRAEDEARLLRQTQRISWIETAGELGALLTEARLIKARQPLFNKRLRRSRQLCAFRLDRGCVDIVYAKSVDFARTPGLYGLFANRRAALSKLRAIADEQQLCYGLLGLERVPAGRPCFRYGLKRCGGACCGAESREEQWGRLEEALERLKLACWPYPGRIALKEESASLCQYHVIHNWLFLGTVRHLQEADQLQQLADHFDCDGYKILCKPVLQQRYPVITLD